MQLRIVKNSQASGSIEVETVHDGKTRSWNTLSSVFDPPMREGFDVFEHINRYWAQLPNEIQENIFNVYERVYDAFNKFWEQESLAKALRPLIAELFFLHPQESVALWVQLRSDIQVPPSIKPRFDPSLGMTGTPERTYLTEDYKKLVPLSITMRIMIPIWGEFIFRGKKDLGTVFKEYQAYQLLAHSNILQSQAMIRLSTFVSHTITRDHSLDAAIISGIGTEDFPTWVLAHAVVRRLCYADVRGLDQKGSSLVTYLYNFITQKTSSLDAQLGPIKPKPDQSQGDGENNLSKLEGFKVKQAVPIGDIAIVSCYIQNAMRYANSTKKAMAEMRPNSLLSRLCPDPAFPSLVKQAGQSASHLMKERISPCQVNIAGWILSEYVNIRAIPHLQKLDVIAIIALAQAYLWYNGHYELAALITAAARDRGRQVHSIGDGNFRIPKVSKALTEEIVVEFCYLRRSNSRAKNVKLNNPVIDAIETVTEQLMAYNWSSNLHPTWDLGPAYVQGSRLMVPGDIREQLGKLILEIDNRIGKSPIAVSI